MLIKNHTLNSFPLHIVMISSSINFMFMIYSLGVINGRILLAFKNLAWFNNMQFICIKLFWCYNLTQVHATCI